MPVRVPCVLSIVDAYRHLRYGRVFHPQILLHQIITNLIIFEMANRNEQQHGFPAMPEQLGFTSCPIKPPKKNPPKQSPTQLPTQPPVVTTTRQPAQSTRPPSRPKGPPGSAQDGVFQPLSRNEWNAQPDIALRPDSELRIFGVGDYVNYGLTVNRLEEGVMELRMGGGYLTALRDHLTRKARGRFYSPVHQFPLGWVYLS